MGKIKVSLYRKDERGNTYKVGDRSAIDQTLLDSLDLPKDKPYCGFIFKRVPLKSLKPLRFKVSTKYHQMFYCFSPESGVKLPPEPAAAGITSRLPKNLAELVRYTRLEHRELIKREGKKAGYSARHDLEDYVKKFLPKAKALLFFKKGKFLTHGAYFKRKNMYGFTDNYMSWHPKLEGLTPAERRSINYQEAVWLKNSGKHRVSLFNSAKMDAYYRFFADMDFQTDRVLFERIGA